MIDYYNLIIGFCLMLLGFLIGGPAIIDELDNKPNPAGARWKVIFGGIGFFILGLIMVWKELF